MLSVLNSWEGLSENRGGSNEFGYARRQNTNLGLILPDRRLEAVECRNPPGPGSTSDVTFLHALILLDPTDPLL